MDRISINLLPIDLKQNKKLLYKKKLINLISISILSVLILTTAVLVVLSVVQNKQLTSEEDQITRLEGTIASLKEKEASVVILKKRLASITQILNHNFPQTDSFLLVTSLLPEKVILQAFISDDANLVTVQGNAPDAATLQSFFDNLTDTKINEGKITKTVISNLNRGNSPRLNFDLQIQVKIDGRKK